MDTSPDNSGESTNSGLQIARNIRIPSPNPRPHLPPYHSFSAYENPVLGYNSSINSQINNIPGLKFENSAAYKSNRMESCEMRENNENHVKEFIVETKTVGGGPGNKYTIKHVICICEALVNSKRIHQLEQFLASLPRDTQSSSEAIVRAKIYVLFHRDAFGDMYKLIQSYEFSPRYHEELQKLWYLAHYKEQEKIRGRPLGAVDKYRLRKKYPLPKSIWDGEETVYCFKAKSRAALKSFYEKNRYPTQDEKKFLAKEIKLNVTQVSNWFKNKRQRDRPHSREPCEIGGMGLLGHSPGSGHGPTDHSRPSAPDTKGTIIYGNGSSVMKYVDEIGGTSGSGLVLAHLRQPISMSKGGDHDGPGFTDGGLTSLTTAIRSTSGPHHQVNIIENSGNGHYGGNISVIQQLQATGHFYQHPTNYESIQHCNPLNAALSY